MNGFFKNGEEKERPGIYKRFKNTGPPGIEGDREGVGCAVVTGNWGELNTVHRLTAGSDITEAIGAGTGARAIQQMFDGGAGEIIAVRAGTGGTKGYAVLEDSSGDAVVTLTNRYIGSRTFSITVRASLEDQAQKQAILSEDGAAVETVAFDAGSHEADGIVAAFGGSAYITAEKTADGTGILAGVAGLAFTAGTDPVVDVEAYSNGLYVTEEEPYDMVIVDTEDPAVHAILAAFVERRYQEGAYPMATVGEPSTVPLEDRMSHAAAFNDEKMHYVLDGFYSSGTLYEGYIAAARIAGMICACPSNQSLTHKVITGATKPGEMLTSGQIKQALRSGCIVLTASKKKQVWIDYGINTLVTPGENQDEGWKKIRRTKARYELMSRIDETIDPMVGKVDNNDHGRTALIAAAQTVCDAMVGEKKLISGTVYEDEKNPASGDSAWFTVAVEDPDSLEKIYLTLTYRFSSTEGGHVSKPSDGGNGKLPAALHVKVSDMSVAALYKKCGAFWLLN